MNKSVLDVCCGSKMMWFDKKMSIVYLLIKDKKKQHCVTGDNWSLIQIF